MSAWTSSDPVWEESFYDGDCRDVHYAVLPGSPAALALGIVEAKPDADGWIPWQPGDSIPVGGVYVRLSDGRHSTLALSGLSWGGGITHYRYDAPPESLEPVTKPAPLDDGGPAFPVALMARQADGQPMTGYDFGVQGMSLRDWLAGKAMQALLVDPERVDQSREECARLSYAMADAMLAARKGGEA